MIDTADLGAFFKQMYEMSKTAKDKDDFVKSASEKFGALVEAIIEKVSQKIGVEQGNNIVALQKGGEEKGRKEAEGYLQAAGLCLEDMQAMEKKEVKEKVRQGLKLEKREADSKRGKRRAVRGGGGQAPQIVTLTNEKGDLIKAIISVGDEEQVEEEVVVGETRVLGNSGVEEQAEMVVVATAENARVVSGDPGLLFQTSSSHPDIVYVMDNT